MDGGPQPERLNLRRTETVASDANETDLTTGLSWSAEELAAIGPACAAFTVRKATRMLTRLYAKAFEPVELEPTQFTLLVACSRQEVVTTTALAARLLMDPSALARNVAVLERRGLLLVSPGDRDGRTRDISITDAGRAALARALPRWEAVQRRLADEVGHDRLLLAVDLVKAMARAGESLLNTSND